MQTYGGPTIEVIGCTFLEGNGVAAGAGAKATISGCIFNGVERGVQVQASLWADVTINGCTFKNCEVGIRTGSGALSGSLTQDGVEDALTDANTFTSNGLNFKW